MIVEQRGPRLAWENSGIHFAGHVFWSGLSQLLRTVKVDVEECSRRQGWDIYAIHNYTGIAINSEEGNWLKDTGRCYKHFVHFDRVPIWLSKSWARTRYHSPTRLSITMHTIDPASPSAKDFLVHYRVAGSLHQISKLLKYHLSQTIPISHSDSLTHPPLTHPHSLYQPVIDHSTGAGRNRPLAGSFSTIIIPQLRGDITNALTALFHQTYDSHSTSTLHREQPHQRRLWRHRTRSIHPHLVVRIRSFHPLIMLHYPCHREPAFGQRILLCFLRHQHKSTTLLIKIGYLRPRQIRGPPLKGRYSHARPTVFSSHRSGRNSSASSP